MHSNTAQPPARVSLHPDEALNWLYFAHDDYHAAGFLPEPKQWSNPGWNEVLEEQWRWWSRELLKQTVGDLDGSPATSLRIGRDAPGFGSLETAPELHAHCQRRWPDFRHWWNRQGAHSWLATLTMSRDVMDTVRDAQLALPTDARVTLYVVGLARTHSFLQARHRSHDNRIFVGGVHARLLQDREEFAAWLSQFTA